MVRKLVCLSALGLTLFVGCLSPDAFDLASALGKLGSNTQNPPLGDLTGAEWAAVSNHAPDLARDLELGLTDAQLAAIPPISAADGQVIADFLDQNNIQTLTQLEAFATQVANGDVTVAVPDAVRNLVDKIWQGVDWGNG